jgi:hypothetical protein
MNISGFNFSDCLFITEGQVDKKIPKRNDCFYVLHNCNGNDYNVNNKIGIQTYTINRQHKDGKYIHFDGNTLTMCWATDLLPHEINTEVHYNNIDYKNIYWVGTIGQGIFGNKTELTGFIDRATQKGKTFIHSDPWGSPKSFEQNCEMIRNSYLAPTIVGTWQKDNHYIPCRIFKNISYGKLGLTNSLAVKQMFGDYVVYSDDTSVLYDLAEEKLLNVTKEQMQESMEFVKNNHTYINRCNSILECFGL